MPTLRQLKRDDWPPLINSIAEIVGDEASLNLFVRFAGRHLTVPKTRIRDHVIDQTIGEEKAALLRQQFGGELLIFPNGRLLLINERNRNIIKDFQGGMKQCDIASKYQLTTRMIHKIITTTKI